MASKLSASAQRSAEDDDTTHPFADAGDRFPIDRRLRSLGYEIVARPNVGPTLWRKRTTRKVWMQSRLELMMQDAGVMP